jgi:hypothetical protein
VTAYWSAGPNPAAPATRRAACDFKAYLDESHSRRFDLAVGGGDNPWSIDLVVEAISCFLPGGFACALVVVCNYWEVPPDGPQIMIGESRFARA